MEQEEVEACWGTRLFFLLTSQTREACERVPRRTQTHQRMHKRRNAPPPPFVGTLPIRSHPSCTAAHTQWRALSESSFSYNPKQNLDWYGFLPHTVFSTTIRPQQIHSDWGGNPLGFFWIQLRKSPVMNCFLCSAESATSRQASFWWAICRYEYAWESVRQATSSTYMRCQRSPLWAVELALCWVCGVILCILGQRGLATNLMSAWQNSTWCQLIVGKLKFTFIIDNISGESF